MSFEVEYSTVDQILVVTQRGVASDVAAAHAFQAEVMRRVAILPIARVLFDNRETEPPNEAVRQALHSWLTTPGRFVAAALLFESEMIAVSINMEAMAQRLPIKAFADRGAALAWLGQR